MIAGRNDPCPCGSGKKYKKCCLEKDQKERQQAYKAMIEEKENEWEYEDNEYDGLDHYSDDDEDEYFENEDSDIETDDEETEDETDDKNSLPGLMSVNDEREISKEEESHLSNTYHLLLYNRHHLR
jgi:uncharacterized protein YecA (UPF0149 family)